MTKKLFGTDGVRGVANTELTPELALALGRAAGVFFSRKSGAHRPKFLIATDSRQSGDMLQSALVAGANSVGVDCDLAGTVPTPGVAYLTRTVSYDAGVMISASHNPVEDNGIKFFSRDGYKLTDDEELVIEDMVSSIVSGGDLLPRPIGAGVGRQREVHDLIDRYIDFLADAFPLDLDGFRLVLDCAHGAASHIAPTVFARLGADLTVLNAEPNGVNINVRCGSTHADVAKNAVVTHSADGALTFDGDSDRVMAVDEQGGLLDGDHILAAIGLDLLKRQELPGRAIVATTYSNGGLRRLIESHGGRIVETSAGDRYVIEAMRREDLVLGGEQSGHIILRSHNTTGDGMLAGLALLYVATQNDVPLSVLRNQLRLMPQELVNVKVRDKNWQSNPTINGAIQRGEERLGEGGRVMVRASGTEPVIRVMAEGIDAETVKVVADEIATVIANELGLEGS